MEPRALRAPPALALVALLAALAPGAQSLPSFWDAAPEAELAASILDAMTDEESLAQVFLLGYLDEGGRPSAYIERWVAERGVGESRSSRAM